MAFGVIFFPFGLMSIDPPSYLRASTATSRRFSLRKQISATSWKQFEVENMAMFGFAPEMRSRQKLERVSLPGQLCWRLRGSPSSSAASPGWSLASSSSSCCSPSWRSRTPGRTGPGGRTWPRWCKLPGGRCSQVLQVQDDDFLFYLILPGHHASNPNQECSKGRPIKYHFTI